MSTARVLVWHVFCALCIFKQLEDRDMRRDAAQASLNKNGDKTRCAQTAVEIEMISEPTFCPSNCVGTAHGAGT